MASREQAAGSAMGAISEALHGYVIELAAIQQRTAELLDLMSDLQRQIQGARRD